MKAYVLHGIGDYRYEEVEKPLVEKKMVLVHVRAAGICGSDIPRIYQNGAYSHPLIPGHEFAGEVVETGEKTNQAWLNKRVGVFPLIPCMECQQCRQKQYEMCSHYNYLGSRTNGGFAEYVRVPEWNLIELPDCVTYEQAAMLEPMAVAVHAIRRVMPKITDKIAICGLGTIGLFVAMFLKEMGTEHVYVAGNKDFQKKMAMQMGIAEECYCDARNENFSEWLKKKTENEGVNVFFECVGKKEVVEQGIAALSPQGKMMLVGNPATDMQLERTLYWKILRSQLQLMGTWNSSFTHENEDDWHFVLKKLEQQQIYPEKIITHHMPMETFMCGFEIMRDKKEDYVKIMMRL